VRHRTIQSKGYLSNRTAPWSSSWSKPHRKVGDALDCHNQLSKLILGVKFTDGLEVVAKCANRQPTTPPP
jgi:putative transposase